MKMSFLLVIMVATGLLLIQVGCEESQSDQTVLNQMAEEQYGGSGWQQFNESPFASFIPTCQQLWLLSPEFADNGSRFAVVGADTSIGTHYTEINAVTVTERRCRSPKWQNRTGLHITEFASLTDASRHSREIRDAIDDINRDIAYDSVFNNWKASGRTFTAIAFPPYPPYYEGDPEDEVGLHIRAQVGRFTIDHSGNAPFELSDSAQYEFFDTLEGMRDSVEKVISRLESFN